MQKHLWREGAKCFLLWVVLRKAIIRKIKDFLWNHFIKGRPPPVPLLWSPYLFFFPTIFWSKKEMILKVVWRVLMGVLRVFEGCCRVFEVCLKGVWKNKIEVWNQSDPPTPPFTKLFHKIFFFTNDGFPYWDFFFKIMSLLFRAFFGIF